MKIVDDDTLDISQALSAAGAVLRHGKSGSILSVDLRSPVEPFSEQWIQWLGALPRLRELYLSGLPVDDSAAENLFQLTRLTVLDLESTAVSDATAERLPTLPRLEVCNLRATRVTAACVAGLRKNMIRTRIIFP